MDLALDSKELFYQNTFLVVHSLALPSTLTGVWASIQIFRNQSTNDTRYYLNFLQILLLLTNCSASILFLFQNDRGCLFIYYFNRVTHCLSLLCICLVLLLKHRSSTRWFVNLISSGLILATAGVYVGATLSADPTWLGIVKCHQYESKTLPVIIDSGYLIIFVISTFSTLQHRKANDLVLFEDILYGTNDIAFLIGMIAITLGVLICNLISPSVTFQARFIGWIALSKLCDELIREEYRVKQALTETQNLEPAHDFELDDGRCRNRFSPNTTQSKVVYEFCPSNSRSTGNHSLLNATHFEKVVVLQMENKSER
ncbi:hypothetical protein K7432_001577 [Basidiobolus ranarum]|uniref:Transmembrane protein n=1 Tax=Basidiobolus ranarum TaxID=34480 RepID=A0ABR2X2V9_9FUNG